jgi:STE24 endopeptidase
MNAQAVALDPERQKRAQQYARIHRRLWALELILGAAYLVLWTAAGWALRVRLALQRWDPGLPWWLELLLIAGAVGVPWFIATLPLEAYGGFLLPRRFGLSTQTWAGWATDLVKGGVIGLTLGAPLLVALFAAIRGTGRWWWLVAAAGYSLFSVVLAALAPVLLMPLFYRFRPLGEDHADLRERLLQLAAQAGARVEGVFTFDMSRRTRAANAALTGLGRTRRIILGDTLLSEFTPDEVETVLAHELGHHVHRDIPLLVGVQTLANFAAFFLVSLGLTWGAGKSGLLGPADPAVLPLLGLLLSALGFVTMPAANAISRWREALADDFALRVTRRPQAFASAMTRLANQNLAEVDPERWVVALLYSHPPLRDRIRKAEDYGAQASLMPE